MGKTFYFDNSYWVAKMNEDDEEDKQGEVTDVQPINDMDWIIKPQTKTGHPVGGLAISNIVFCQDR